MGKHVVLPKTALDDVAALISLDGGQMRLLAKCFDSSDSIPPSHQRFVQHVAEEVGLDQEQAETVILVSQFLLAVAEEGTPAEEILEDVRSFISKHDASPGKELTAAFDGKRDDLAILISLKPNRAIASKVRYLGEVFPTVDSFRSVCELRPVFDGPSGQEEIIGYVPVVLLEVKLSDSNGEESTIHLHLSPGKLNDLEKVLSRTSEKLAVIRQKFGEELLDESREN